MGLELIRRCTFTQEEREHLYRLGRAFNEEYFDIPLDESKLRSWADLHEQHGVVYISDTGYVSALYFPDPLRDWDVLTETAWYDTGRNGVRLLKQLIQHGKDEGFDEVRVCTLNTTHQSVISLLGRMGFREIERSHRLII